MGFLVAGVVHTKWQLKQIHSVVDEIEIFSDVGVAGTWFTLFAKIKCQIDSLDNNFIRCQPHMHVVHSVQLNLVQQQHNSVLGQWFLLDAIN